MSVPSSPPAAPPEFLALTYRPDLHLLVSRWQRPVSCAELRQGYRATLALAQAVGCPYWQVDLRGRNAPAPDARQWLTHTFIPRLRELLPGPAYLGYLLSPQLLQQLGPPESDPAQVAFFAEEGPLTAWLTQCQHRSREALAAAGFVAPATGLILPAA